MDPDPEEGQTVDPVVVVVEPVTGYTIELVDPEEGETVDPVEVV